MQVALQTAQNHASIETPLKAEQLMTAHFNLAILTDDIASNTHVNAPAGQTGIPASQPPTSADAEETICKALNTDLHLSRRDRAPQRPVQLSPHIVRIEDQLRESQRVTRAIILGISLIVAKLIAHAPHEQPHS